MPRPRSDEKRAAILSAATRVIVSQGLGASTAGIAHEAGIANGSLFTYFETKNALFNQLYLELKIEVAATAMRGLAEGKDRRDQFFQVWRNWTHWAIQFPEKRRALAQLSVSEELSAETRAAGHKTMAAMRDLMDQARAKGPMRDAPLGFVITLMSAIAEATMDMMTQDPKNATKHAKMGFEALWRMIA
jgi:AcrR family transcriptional regulator